MGFWGFGVLGFWDGFGPCFGFILAPSWRQVGAKLATKVDLEGSKANLKKNMKRTSRSAK